MSFVYSPPAPDSFVQRFRGDSVVKDGNDNATQWTDLNPNALGPNHLVAKSLGPLWRTSDN